MRVGDIIRAVEEFAPLGIQENWDNSGLCIGSEDDETGSVLVGFDCTPELIDEAVACGAGLVITHHPLLFRGIKRIDGTDPVGAALVKAVRGGIAVYAAHTTADKVIGGVSGAMARKIGLEDIGILCREEDGVGLGAVGNLPSPLSAEEVLSLLKERFSLSVIRCSRPVREPVRRIAVCGGAGADLIGEARRAGAQLYVTGDLSYHRFAVPEGFMVADIGHFESEVEIVSILISWIRKKIPTFAVRASERLNDGNLVRYYL
ncbi:MAG: Nif3-like dinuclear metal center hexameric protein [Bacteroidales bacterium]|nr:Nif3-like dinuclear metal center hexameric protein [Bacteroidales bacterium]